MKPGETTSEFKETQKTNTLSSVIITLGVLIQAASSLQTELSAVGLHVPDWLGVVVLLGGVAMRTMNTLGYQASRAKVKSGLAFLLAVTLLSGCFEVYQYDPQTVKNIDAAIVHAQVILDRTDEALRVETDKERQQWLTGLLESQKAHLLRLQTWKTLEENKKGEGD